MRFYIWLLIAGLFTGCSKEHDKTEATSASLSVEIPKSEDDVFELVQSFKEFESYIGKPVEGVKQDFGAPIDTVVEKHAIEEDDAIVYYFEMPVSEVEKIYLKAAVQYGKVVGLQLSSVPNADKIYSSSRYLIAGRGIDWTPSAGRSEKFVARTGDLAWQIGFEQTSGGLAGIVNVGTIKYSWCKLAWEAEDLWGEDGFGNKVDSIIWVSPTEKRTQGQD